VNLQMVATLARLSEYSPAHVLLRFPRDLRFDDLKSANAVIIGSECSNPWAVITERTANFQIHCNSGMQGATVVNLKPQSGEAPSYTSHWKEPTQRTYAVISFVPDLSGYGKLLVLGGLDAAATQAVGEALLRPEIITPILQRAGGPMARSPGSKHCCVRPAFRRTQPTPMSSLTGFTKESSLPTTQISECASFPGTTALMFRIKARF
jgi:hypothetical protein